MSNLSIVIPFRNEGIQVSKTIESIINNCNELPEIIVINDCSDDSFKYYFDKYPIKYIKNQVRLGSSLSKELGVNLASNENILLIDAHMRFTKNNWQDIIDSKLSINPNKIYCLYTVGFDEKTEVWHNNIHSGCYLSLSRDKILSSKWIRNTPRSDLDIPVIMGASYLFTKSYWNYLKGFQGLSLYGREEEYISIKSWGLGDGCELVHNCRIAHLYRTTAPTPITSKELWNNILVISYTLFPDELQKNLSNLMGKVNQRLYKSSLSNLDLIELSELRKYYISSGYEFDKFYSINKKFFDLLNYSV